MTEHTEPALSTGPITTLALREHYECSVDVSRTAPLAYVREMTSACLGAAAEWLRREGVEAELVPFYSSTSCGVRWELEVGHGAWDANEDDAESERSRWLWSDRWRYWADRFTTMARPRLALAPIVPLRSGGMTFDTPPRPIVSVPRPFITNPDVRRMERPCNYDSAEGMAYDLLPGPLDDYALPPRPDPVRLEDVYCNRCGAPHPKDVFTCPNRPGSTPVEPWHGKAGCTPNTDPWLS